MKKIKVALVGFGFGGSVFHGPLIAAEEGFEVSKIQAHDPHRVAEAKKQFPNAEVVSYYDSILQDNTIMLVVITIPNFLHYPTAKRALEAGKNVVVDKPFTLSTEEAETLIALADKKDLLLTVFHNRRWDSDFLTIQKIIKKGSLGQLVEYEAHYDRYRDYIKEDAWKEEGRAGSGILYDLGSHLIDQALCLFGEPEKVFADLRKQRENSEVVDNFEVILYYPNLKVSLKAGMLVSQKGPRYQLIGRKGSFIKYGIDPQEEALKKGESPKDHPSWGQEQDAIWGTLNATINGDHFIGNIESEEGTYPLFYKNVYKVLLQRDTPLVKAVEAVLVIKIIELAERSNEQGKVLSV